jgi:hypothetical protein
MPINPIEPVWLKPVVTLRPVRGNLATKHDRSPAQLEKTLRRQFGSFYDQKKIGNTNHKNQQSAALTPSDLSPLSWAKSGKLKIRILKP